MSAQGCVCPFCTAADPKWPDLYMRPKTDNGNPSARFRTLVALACLACGATWTRGSAKWQRPTVQQTSTETGEPK